MYSAHEKVSSRKVQLRKPALISISLLLSFLSVVPLSQALTQPPEIEAIRARLDELKVTVDNYDQKHIGRAVDADNARLDLFYFYMAEKNHAAARDMLNLIVSKETFRPSRVLDLLNQYIKSDPELADESYLVRAKEYFENKIKRDGRADSSGSTNTTLSEEKNKTDLQAGSYLYLGQQPGRNPARAFTINSLGELAWQHNTREILYAIREQVPRDIARASAASTEKIQLPEQFESYNYPVIKWQPKPVSTMPGAFVQLWTTYEGKVKYKVTLFKAPTLPRRMEITLLDQNGFKLTEFRVSMNDWAPVPGSSLYEARNDGYCSESDYKLARDISVK